MTFDECCDDVWWCPYLGTSHCGRNTARTKMVPEFGLFPDGSEESAVEPVSFDDMVFTLGTINHRHEVSVQPRNFDSTPVRKHLRMMDLLALLLVTEEKGDVASAAFCRRDDGLVIVFAKNRPCTEDELKYIRSLVCLIMTLAQPPDIGKAMSVPIGKTMSVLLGTIFTNCEKKIRSTHNDMVKASDSLRTAVNMLPLVLGQTLWSKVYRRFTQFSIQWQGPDDHFSHQHNGFTRRTRCG
jgi:hypothetical protein